MIKTILKKQIDNVGIVNLSSELIEKINNEIPFHLWDEVIIGIIEALSHKVDNEINAPVSSFFSAEIIHYLKEMKQNERYLTTVQEA